MGLFGGSSDRGELLELQTRVGRLEEQVARLSAALAATRSGGSAPVESAAATDQYAEARALASSGHKIEAIKVVREQSGLSLKAAKDLVETW
jgi:large subunit ribosomal protein L7/L12